MSTSTDHLAAMNAPPERRFYPRVTPPASIYVAFGSNNLGTLLNVSENGFSVGTPNRLDVNSVYRVFLSLDGVSSAITVSVRTVWTADSQSSSGIQLLDLSEHDREKIRKWIAVQTSRNETQNDTLDNWFSPKSISTETAEVSRQTIVEPLPPKRTESPATPKFVPMPLPIHGEFTYEPPPGLKNEVLSPRRHNRAPRRTSRSSISPLVLWTVFMAAICLAAGWSYRHELGSFRNELSDKFLHSSAQVATTESAHSTDQATAQNPSSAVPDSPVAVPPPEAPSEPEANASAPAGDSADTTPVTPPQTAMPKTVPHAAAAPRYLEPKTLAPAPKPSLSASTRRPSEVPAPEIARSYVADPPPSSASTNESIAARASTPATTPAPVTAAPPPAITTTASVNATPAPPKNQPFANAPAVNDSTAKTSPVAVPSRRSAITGSITESNGSSDLSTIKPSGNVAAAAPAAAFAQPSTPRANSFVASRSIASSSPVVQMDTPQASEVEVTAPRGFAASYVSLPGERVLRSSSITMHVQRSVRIPGERVPGQRWLWRGHLKVAVGELTSRVDPQVSQLPVPYGSITVQATIDKGGYVTNLQPLYGSYTLLPNVARAIREWRYETTYVDNKPAETQAKIEIDIHPPSARPSKP